MSNTYVWQYLFSRCQADFLKGLIGKGSSEEKNWCSSRVEYYVLQKGKHRRLGPLKLSESYLS